MSSSKNKKPDLILHTMEKKAYQEIRRKQFMRLVFMSILPHVILVTYFFLHYAILQNDTNEYQIQQEAESKAQILDNYLNERFKELSHLSDIMKESDDPVIKDKILNSNSNFEKIVYFKDMVPVNIPDTNGNYSIKLLPKKNWLEFGVKLGDASIIGLIRLNDLFDIITPKDSNLKASIISKHSLLFGDYKIEDLDFDEDENQANDSKTEVEYAYSQLDIMPWKVLVKNTSIDPKSYLTTTQWSMVILSSVIVLILFSAVFVRTKNVAEIEKEKYIARKQLEHASKLASVGELAGGIAHEINNPLAIISSEIGLIQDMMSPEFGMDASFEEIEPHLYNIEEAVFRCRNITRRLLSFVRHYDVHLDAANINEIINEMIESFVRREMSVSNINVETNLEENLPNIVTDDNQLRQVFLNIINNAADAITAPGTITVSTELKKQEIIISISDTGMGISKDEMDKIFMPFFTTKEVGKGTGLGLSVSFGIVTNLGGRIEVDSIPGKGSTFKIYFPVKA